MKFEEYEFDVTRLWDEPQPRTEADKPARFTKRPRPPREPSAEVIPLPRSRRRPSFDAKACLKKTRAELAEISISLRFRDVVRRNGLADRCLQCGRCREILG